MTRSTTKNSTAAGTKADAPKAGSGPAVDQAPPSNEPGRKVTIRSATPSLRRAGIAFTRDGVEIDCDALTRDQVAAILSEPLLTVDVRDQLAVLLGDESTDD